MTAQTQAHHTKSTTPFANPEGRHEFSSKDQHEAAHGAKKGAHANGPHLERGGLAVGP